jgi:hypothetical protein
VACSAACCGEKPDIFVAGAALETRWAIFFPKRKNTRVKNATTGNLFTNRDKGFFSRIVFSRNLKSGEWTVLRENLRVKTAGAYQCSGGRR